MTFSCISWRWNRDFIENGYIKAFCIPKLHCSYENVQLLFTWALTLLLQPYPFKRKVVLIRDLSWINQHAIWKIGDCDDLTFSKEVATLVEVQPTKSSTPSLVDYVNHLDIHISTSKSRSPQNRKHQSNGRIRKINRSIEERWVDAWEKQNTHWKVSETVQNRIFETGISMPES